MTDKHAGGRPLKFQSVKEVQKKIDVYFASCDPHMEEITEWLDARDGKGQLKKDEHGLNYLVEVTHKVMTKQQPYLITGLALALDTSRETLLDYEDRPEFSDTIKAAKDKCQWYTEHNLNTASNATGSIFSLKNNYGWREKTELENSGEQKIIVETRKANADKDD